MNNLTCQLHWGCRRVQKIEQMKSEKKNTIEIAKNIFLYMFFLLLLLFLHIEFYEYATDDAFIHFRVSKNLMESGRPYFNHDEPLKVSTSSGWTVFLSLISTVATKLRLANNLPLLAAIANALILSTILFLYKKILEAILEKDISTKAGLLFQIPCIVAFLPSSIQLMETPLTFLVAGIGFYWLLKKKVWGFMFLGLAVHFRPEMIILLLLTGFLTLLHKQYKLKEILLPIFTGILPFIVYDLYFFKTIVPHSAIAKKVVYSFTYLDTFFNIFFEAFINAIFAIFKALKGTSNISFVYLLVAIPLILLFSLVVNVLLTLKRGIQKEKLWPLIFGLSSLFIAAGYVFGRALIFDWYRPLYLFPALLSFFLFTFSSVRLVRRVAKTVIAVIFLISSILLAQSLYASVGNRSFFPLFAMGARVKTYLAVGKILNDDYPGATLLTPEIGAIGYTFRGKIFDAVGLASADAVPFHPMKIPEQRENGSIGAIPPEYVQAKHPDIIVSHDRFAKAFQAGEEIKHYNVIQIPVYLPEDAEYSESRTLWKSKYINVYIKKSLPVTENIKYLAVSGENL